MPLLRTLITPYLFLLVLGSGCIPYAQEIKPADLTLMPQSPIAFLPATGATAPLLAVAEQQNRADHFLRQFFAPWYSDRPLEETRHPFWALEWIATQRVYAENLRPLEHQRVEEFYAQVQSHAYPSSNRPAISLKAVDIRALPTNAPLFNNPRRAGEGFPFDYLQHGVLAANTPVLVTHGSADGAWLFIETPLLYGWVPTGTIAWVDQDTIATWNREQYLALTRDNLPITDPDGIFRFTGGIGTLLPLVSTEGKNYQVMIAVADVNHQAVLKNILVPADAAAIFPIPLSTAEIAALADTMMGQPYGWGDLYGNRDCSGTIRDLFTPFGIWLPRNSAQQANIGQIIPLAHLPPLQREDYLLRHGIPFVTLVWLPGHIMLYLGEYQGRAALLHTMWGVQTRSLFGVEGRWLVAQTAITSLEPGKERKSLLLDVSSLRERLGSFNILVP